MGEKIRKSQAQGVKLVPVLWHQMSVKNTESRYTTDSMKLSPSSEADRFCFNKETPCIL